MKIKKILTMLAGAMLLLTGCIKEELLAPEGGSADGITRIALSIDNAELIKTRSEASENECQINDAYLLVFGSGENGTYKGGEKVNLNTQIKLNNENVKTPVITTQLAIADGDKIVLLLNTGIGVFPTDLKIGETTTSQINKLFPTTGWDLNPIDDKLFGRGLPMSGEMIYNKKTGGSETLVCTIKRSVAKIQLQVNIAAGDDVTNLVSPTSVKWAMYNVLSSTKGTVFDPNGEITKTEDIKATDFTNSKLEKTDITQGLIYNKSFYMPEYPSATMAKETGTKADQFSAERTCMLLQVGTAPNDYYYRIDLFDHEKKQFIDIRRNTHIMVTITKVNSYGYYTIEEALANPGSNLEFEIKVSGENDNVLISNGQYALSLECDELIVVGEPNKEYTLGKVSFIDIAGAGLPKTNKMVVGKSQYDGEVVVLTGATTVSKTPQEIKVKLLPAAFNYYFSTVDIMIGNISKRVFIFVNPGFKSEGQSRLINWQYHDFPDVQWVHKEQGIDVVSVPGAKRRALQITCEDNITPLNVSEMSDPAAVPVFGNRSAECYFLRDQSTPTRRGRTKIIIDQSAPTYVGWFGGTPNNGSNGRYSKRLITHSESDLDYWSISERVATNANSPESGLSNTKIIMAKGNASQYGVFSTCYWLNDRNRDGLISADEPINWYLPAKNQLMSIWVAKEGMNTSFADNYYWSSTEQSDLLAWRMSMSTGLVEDISKQNKYQVRCVRDL